MKLTQQTTPLYIQALTGMLTEEDYMPAPTRNVLRGSKVNTYDKKETVHLSEPLHPRNRKEERPMATERIL